MTSPDDESTSALDPAEQQRLHELGESLRADDPHLADDLTGRPRHRTGTRWRRRCAFGLGVAALVVASLLLLGLVGPGPVVVVVVAVMLTAVAVDRIWALHGPDRRGRG